MKPELKERIIRLLLGAILLLVALSAFGCGYYGIAGEKNIPLEWLEGSPFSSYLIPSLFLFIFIGGFALFSAVLSFKAHARYQKFAFIFGILILLWIVMQLWIIGYVSGLQPAIAVTGVVIIVLSCSKAFIRKKSKSEEA